MAAVNAGTSFRSSYSSIVFILTGRYSGAIVNFSQGEDGTWTAKQATLAQGLPPTDNPNILEIDWSCGPVKVAP